MTDFKERLEMFKEGEMIDDEDIKSINNIIDVFQNKYNVTLCEENASTFISHVCAAFYRFANNEEVDPLPDEVFKEIESLDTYQDSLNIFNDVMQVVHKPFSDSERAYVLLHINNLISLLKSQGEWN